MMRENQARGFGCGKRHKRRLWIAGLLSFCVVIACLPAAGLAAGSPPMLTEDQYATADFVSHMPILALEMTGSAGAENDFFVGGILSAYDGNGGNSPGAAPAASAQAVIRNMTDQTNDSTAKCDYYIRLDAALGLLGLEETDEYLLLGAQDDPSLIRNYLGYRIAAGMMADAPGFQLCEVFFRTARGDRYQGVYLLVAKKTKDTAVLFYHGAQQNGIPIDTYAYLNSATVGRMYIPFLESPQWDDRYGEIIGRVSTAESVLYATNSATFYGYVDRFDVSSFVNHFILRELMEDYTGVTEGYYEYDTARNLFAAAPIWNFEHALDNQAAVPVEVDDIQFDGAVYYEQFFKSHQFATEVQRTYLALRRGVLDEPALMRYVDEAAAYVAPAVARDWSRWNAYGHHNLTPIAKIESESEAPPGIVFFDRQTETFADEIRRIRFQLREHSLHMALDLTAFDFSEREIGKEIVLNTSPVWPVVFLVVFFALVRFARRYGV